MNLNQIVDMVVRIFVRKGVRWGINKGAGMLAKKGTPAGTAGAKGPAAGGHDPRALAKRARQAARITRRMGR